MKICPECHAEFEDTVNECPQHKIGLQTKNQNPLIGVCLADRYKIISVIGSGGTGVVYKAHHDQMDRFVAIKMMHSHMVARPEALKTFYAEAKTVAQLKHHNIITLFDFGMGPGNQPFLVMDYINGSSLKTLMEKTGPMPFDQLQTLLPQIIEGLSYAHGEGIVHQDLKPENIMLSSTSDGVYKVTLVDFGMAVLFTQDKDLAASGNRKKKFAGSPYYMSPEQCLSNTTIDQRSDIYSLSFVLYEALCGKLPFEMKSGMAMMDSHVREMPMLFKSSNPAVFGLQVCTEITGVFLKAMAKDPEDRYQTIAEFGAELDAALARDTVKLKAIKHRSVAAEQVLVHARQTMQHMEALDTGKYKALTESTMLESQLHSGKQFLSRQAAIEAAYLNEAPTAAANKPVAIPIEGIVTKLLNRLRGICPSAESDISINDISKTITECPYCQAPVTQGVQFCLNCQRKLAALPGPTKLSETRNGNSFTHHQIKNTNLEENTETRHNIQSLRKPRQIPSISKLQKGLNYALIFSVVIGSIIFANSYFDMGKSWKALAGLVRLPSSANHR